MKLRIVLLAGAATLFLGAGFSPADAGGSQVFLEQYGAQNNFGSAQSARFVNGVVDALARRMGRL